MRVIVFPRHHKIPISRQQNKNCQVKKKINVKRSNFFLKKLREQKRVESLKESAILSLMFTRKVA